MPQNSVESTSVRRVFLAVVIFFFGLAPAGMCQQSDMRGQTVDVEGLFSFRLPAGWSKQSSFNVAEVRGEWARGETRLVYIWGQTESGSYGERRQPWMNDYEETTTRLGGRRANIRSFSSVKDGQRMYQAELNVGNWEKGEVQLFMRIEGSDPKILDLAKEVFKSVTLPLPSPERPTPQKF
jgi:hypothetical protein